MASNAAVAQLCFGSGPTELNLKAVQQRGADLIRVIDTLLIGMQTQGAHWTSFLDKLAVINMTYMQIMLEVRPLLRQYAVYPKYVDNPGIENSLPEMLASRLLPEQVEAEATWRSQLAGGIAQLASQPSVCLEYADAQVVELQDMVDWLTNVQHVIKGHEGQINPTPQDLPRGVLDPKGKLRREIETTSKEIAVAAAAAAAAREQAGGGSTTAKPPVTAVVVGQKRPRAGIPPAQAAPANTARDQEEPSAADILLNKIVTGELWRQLKHA